ncbi:hypothetical protein HI914_00887 [Erysiphe necator]|uniref:Uncharacterized protein n=1 Tax=Uncinula necator TaxID=52586 RepID=A0A0B1PID3_UNCNE|nr:hypothetical protein HI914_00887 [Erysiphe necator]KHJ36234.1 hypothetical protein EV44_g5202 [Erysiphe necator]
MSLVASTFRWLQLKRYQYEVTFSLYMLTPTEKFIFNSFLFLFFSMIIIAATLYLPQHLAFLTNRAWFYYNGPSPELFKTTAAKSTAEDILSPISTAASTIAKDMAKATSATIISLVNPMSARYGDRSILVTEKEL